MKAKVVWLDEAASDLEKILDFIEAKSPQGALAMALALREGVDLMLPDFPDAGRRGRVAGTRELVVGGTPFIAVYRRQKAPPRIEILRILHGAQKWPPE